MKFTMKEKQIPYEDRNSIYIDVGSTYGTGFKQPVGSKKVTHGYNPAKNLEHRRQDIPHEDYPTII